MDSFVATNTQSFAPDETLALIEQSHEQCLPTFTAMQFIGGYVALAAGVSGVMVLLSIPFGYVSAIAVIYCLMPAANAIMIFAGTCGMSLTVAPRTNFRSIVTGSVIALACQALLAYLTFRIIIAFVPSPM